MKQGRGLLGIKKYWPYGFFMLVVIFTFYMDILIAREILDGDTSGYLYNGYMMARENRIYLELIGANEVRLFDIAFFISPFFFCTKIPVPSILGLA